VYQDQLKRILVKLFEYKEILGLIFAVCFTFMLDLTFTPKLPFWLPLALIGFITGLLIGSERAAIYAGVGAMIGRLISLFILLILYSHLRTLLDLLYNVAEELIGLPDFPGTLIVILLSVSIAGIITCLGGIIGGSIRRITALLQQSNSIK
jgi:hypothetical protein